MSSTSSESVTSTTRYNTPPSTPLLLLSGPSLHPHLLPPPTPLHLPAASPAAPACLLSRPSPASLSGCFSSPLLLAIITPTPYNRDPSPSLSSRAKETQRKQSMTSMVRTWAASRSTLVSKYHHDLYCTEWSKKSGRFNAKDSKRPVR